MSDKADKDASDFSDAWGLDSYQRDALSELLRQTRADGRDAGIEEAASAAGCMYGPDPEDAPMDIVHEILALKTGGGKPPQRIQPPLLSDEEEAELARDGGHK